MLPVDQRSIAVSSQYSCRAWRPWWWWWWWFTPTSYTAWLRSQSSWWMTTCCSLGQHTFCIMASATLLVGAGQQGRTAAPHLFYPCLDYSSLNCECPGTHAYCETVNNTTFLKAQKLPPSFHNLPFCGAWAFTLHTTPSGKALHHCPMLLTKPLGPSWRGKKHRRHTCRFRSRPSLSSTKLSITRTSDVREASGRHGSAPLTFHSFFATMQYTSSTGRRIRDEGCTSRWMIQYTQVTVCDATLLWQMCCITVKHNSKLQYNSYGGCLPSTCWRVLLLREYNHEGSAGLMCSTSLLVF